MQLKSKRIITGGASGIADETVRAFAREGVNVVSVDVNEIRGTPVAVEATRVSARGNVTCRFVAVAVAPWHTSVPTQSRPTAGHHRGGRTLCQTESQSSATATFC